MKSTIFTTTVSTALLCFSFLVEAKLDAAPVHAVGRRHRHHRDVHSSVIERSSELEVVQLRDVEAEIEKRAGTCQFPKDAGLVPVNPSGMNAGWAIAPDIACTPGHYCTYACPPGQLSMQWDPSANSYFAPGDGRQRGGLKCDDNGNIQKPFPDRPYCQDGAGGVSVTNKAGSAVNFCQTVLPGNESMLIPTNVQSTANLAVTTANWWNNGATHAEYFINGPGVSTADACKWGDSSKPVGNWAPYTAGMGQDANGVTTLHLGWNPVYLEDATPFKNTMPSWGVKLECQKADGSPCSDSCSIDPAIHGVNQITNPAKGGAGGCNYCIVTVPKGGKATYVVFNKGSSKRLRERRRSFPELW
ncbi:MAG: hypothetical protein M1836_005954 [Candelina mexicana]|nr:MAG: hypothetical protein M1836_005954 [Candelina mexicana]